jgi:hypothetical protein
VAMAPPTGVSSEWVGCVAILLVGGQALRPTSLLGPAIEQHPGLFRVSPG